MVLLTALDEIPDFCNSCFKVTLTSLDSRSRSQGEGNWAFSPSRNFQTHFKLLGTTQSYNQFAPNENINLVRSCLLGKIKS